MVGARKPTLGRRPRYRGNSPGFPSDNRSARSEMHALKTILALLEWLRSKGYVGGKITGA